MNKKFFLILFLMINILGCLSYRPIEQLSPLEREIPSLHYVPPSPTTWELENGLKVVFMRDDEVPLVFGSLFVRSGAIWAPELPVGMVSTLGSQMRQGGTKTYSPEELDLVLEKMAAGISSAFGSEFGQFSFSGLRGDREKILEIFSEVLFKPRFDSARLNLWRGQAKEGIRRRKENPDIISNVSLNQLLYPKSIYGKVVKSVDVDKLKTQDLTVLHQKIFTPDGAILALGGDITEEEAKALANKYFGGWRSTGWKPRKPADTGPVSPAGVYFIETPFPQASVRIGQRGPKRLEPDHVSIMALNDLFGQSVSSLLFKHVRTELGLAYSISGGTSLGLVSGSNIIGFGTKSESVGTAILASLNVLTKVQEGQVAASELEEVKRAIENSFVFAFDSPFTIADRYATLKMMDYPGDWDSTFLTKVRNLTLEDVIGASKNRWDSKNLIFVVAGDRAAYSALEKTVHENPAVFGSSGIIKAQFSEELVLK